MNPTNIFTGFPRCDCSSEEEHEVGTSLCRSADHWCFALSNIRQVLFNNTSCSVPSPAMHLVNYEKKLRIARNESTTFCEPDIISCVPYSFNTDPLSTKDIFSYRKSRSEHLLIRMLHFFYPYKSSHSFIRLSTGVFLIQKFGHHDPVHLSSPVALSNAIDFFAQESTMAPIDTFSFNDLFNDMMQQTSEKPVQNTHIPFTYTLGVRYTNPYKHMKDLLVRGNIPLWCQTLFITECMRILPIHHGTCRKGLLPFAKDIEFHFKYLDESDPFPDLLIMFERFAMEVSDPHMMLDIPANELAVWKHKQAVILSGVLFCDIPEDTAELITKLADAWAAEQGISVS